MAGKDGTVMCMENVMTRPMQDRAAAERCSALASNVDFTNLGSLAFMNQYPLIPEGGDNTADKGTYSSVPKASRVSYMSIGPGTHYSLNALTLLGVPIGIPNREGDPHKATCNAADDVGHTRIPVFWLPYKQNSHYRMTLRPAGVAQPDFFLTDAVDGCSVYVEGTRTNPTVHHINAAETKHQPLDGSAPFGTTGNYSKDTLAFQAKDTRMTDRFTASDEPKRVAAGLGLTQAKYIKNDDYMLRNPTALQQQVALSNTQARRVDANEDIHKVDVATQGTVFGIRDAHTGEWTFYFQRRLVSIFYHNDKKGVPFVKSKWRALGYRMYPILVQEFWPGGGGHLVVRP